MGSHEGQISVYVLIVAILLALPMASIIGFLSLRLRSGWRTAAGGRARCLFVHGERRGGSVNWKFRDENGIAKQALAPGDENLRGLITFA